MAKCSRRLATSAATGGSEPECPVSARQSLSGSVSGIVGLSDRAVTQMSWRHCRGRSNGPVTCKQESLEDCFSPDHRSDRYEWSHRFFQDSRSALESRSENIGTATF